MRALLGKDRWIPLTLVAGMLVVIAVNAAMVTIALRSDNGLVDDKPFVRGLAYNRVLEEAARQDALGWRVAVAVEPGGADRARVVVRAAGREGEPLAGARVEGTLERPVERLDPVALTLAEAAPGVHESTRS